MEIPHFSPTELEVLKGIALSKSSNQIALELGISYWNVQQRRRNISSKLSKSRHGMVNNNIAALTRFAIGQGLIEIEPEWLKESA